MLVDSSHNEYVTNDKNTQMFLVYFHIFIFDIINTLLCLITI